MNWPPDQVRLSVLIKRSNHAIGLAIMLSVSNPLRNCKKASSAAFLLCEWALRLEETRLQVDEHLRNMTG